MNLKLFKFKLQSTDGARTAMQQLLSAVGR